MMRGQINTDERRLTQNYTDKNYEDKKAVIDRAWNRLGPSGINEELAEVHIETGKWIFPFRWNPSGVQ